MSEPRTFFCRVCQREETTYDGNAPDGWWSLTRTWRTHPKGKVRIGLFCSSACGMEFHALEMERSA